MGRSRGHLGGRGVGTDHKPGSPSPDPARGRLSQPGRGSPAPDLARVKPSSDPEAVEEGDDIGATEDIEDAGAEGKGALGVAGDDDGRPGLVLVLDEGGAADDFNGGAVAGGGGAKVGIRQGRGRW